MGESLVQNSPTEWCVCVCVCGGGEVSRNLNNEAA